MSELSFIHSALGFKVQLRRDPQVTPGQMYMIDPYKTWPFDYDGIDEDTDFVLFFNPQEDVTDDFLLEMVEKITVDIASKTGKKPGQHHEGPLL